MSLDPRKLREEAAQLRAEADQREREARILVQHLRDQASLKERTAELLDEGERLPDVNHGGKLRDVDVTAVGLKTQQGLKVSLRTLATAVGVSHATLSLALNGKKPIRRSVADKVAKLIPSLPATRATYPKGFLED